MSPFETKIKIDIPRFQHVDFWCFSLILCESGQILARGTEVQYCTATPLAGLCQVSQSFYKDPAQLFPSTPESLPAEALSCSLTSWLQTCAYAPLH